MTLAALRALDLVNPAEVVRWAEELVRDGATDPTLIDLSALSKWEFAEVDKLLEAFAGRSGLGELNELQIGMLAASDIARQLNQGMLEPVDAARAMWKVALLAPASEVELRVYIGLASEWDDDADHRDLYDEEIRSRALATEGWYP
jgi:hypothetical protein